MRLIDIPSLFSQIPCASVARDASVGDLVRKDNGVLESNPPLKGIFYRHTTTIHSTIQTASEKATSLPAALSRSIYFLLIMMAVFTAMAIKLITSAHSPIVMTGLRQRDRFHDDVDELLRRLHAEIE